MATGFQRHLHHMTQPGIAPHAGVLITLLNRHKHRQTPLKPSPHAGFSNLAQGKQQSQTSIKLKPNYHFNQPKCSRYKAEYIPPAVLIRDRSPGDENVFTRTSYNQQLQPSFTRSPHSIACPRLILLIRSVLTFITFFSHEQLAKTLI